jgi:hypothetical protein
MDIDYFYYFIIFNPGPKEPKPIDLTAFFMEMGDSQALKIIFCSKPLKSFLISM